MRWLLSGSLDLVVYRIITENAADIEAIHFVREDFLSTVLREGAVGPELKKEIGIVLEELAASSDMVLCTCSSIAQATQELVKNYATPVLRIGRPMAEKAIRAKRIGVIAAIESTLETTQSLLNEAARESKRGPVISIKLCRNAWKYFEANEQEKYLQKIAECIDETAKNNDLVILAQASMAAAIAFCKTDKAVLASPESAIDYCLDNLFFDKS